MVFAQFSLRAVKKAFRMVGNESIPDYAVPVGYMAAT